MKAAGVFFHCDRFASQRGFFNLQIYRFEQTGIGGHAVTGMQENHIARHQLTRRDFDFRSIAQNGCGGRRHLLQRFNRAFGAIFLNKAQQNREQHDHRNGD